MYSENNAYLNTYLYMMKSTKYASNKKTQVLGYKYGRLRGSVGMGIPWGFPRDFAVGMGTEIQSPRQSGSPVIQGFMHFTSFLSI